MYKIIKYKIYGIYIYQKQNTGTSAHTCTIMHRMPQCAATTRHPCMRMSVFGMHMAIRALSVRSCAYKQPHSTAVPLRLLSLRLRHHALNGMVSHTYAEVVNPHIHAPRLGRHCLATGGPWALWLLMSAIHALHSAFCSVMNPPRFPSPPYTWALSPARHSHTDLDQDSIWLVYKWEGLRPLSLFLEGGPPPIEPGLFQYWWACTRIYRRTVYT